MIFYYSGIEQCIARHYWLGIRDHYLIHFILEGSGTCAYANDVYELTKGQAFLSRPEQKIHYTADSKNPWKYCWIAFSGVQAKSLIEYTDFGSEKHVVCFDNIKEVEHTILKLNSTDTKQSAQYTLILSYLMYLFSCLDAKEKKDQHTQGIKGRHLDVAKSFVDKNYSTSIKVESIASHVGVSRKYLNEIFKEFLNVTTQQFLLNKRMEQSAILLGNTTLSIKEIAHSVGYYDSLLFSKMFKRKYGVSPNGFRERM